ncbi:DUF3043 domain-containing protein [Ornithinimicrobium tianjinense]|uniref:DUF3043 domain-containing protein n=1 Tax=Ornithinimicrobium tianjinense TaxID=1195761 RepID=A0A917BIM8_9MICO|nr:DUF3043 domain-containing protein [Ornithinimicrobium tianjinense]GGF45011.1 hypothetical protein GCM10011366_10910 [Ornithinimicrobium tianjinense]
MLFSKKPTEPTPAPTPEADETSRPAGKGRPTPKRRDAQAANRRPLVGAASSPELKARARSERAHAREAMLRGEEKYLPARDQGPERRFLRDSVDARRSVGEYLLPAMLVVLALTFVPDSRAGVASMVAAYSLIALTILNSWLLWRSVRAQFAQAFGHEAPKGSGMYVVMRSLQMRGSRVPRPAVNRGDAVVRRR